MQASHQSPVKQIKTVASSFTGSSSAMDTSPLLNWASSPLYQFDCFSPEGSNISFTMTSPPCQIQSYEADSAQQGDSNINSSFSPSIFSPKDKVGSRLPKKRDLYSSVTHVRGGIADVTEKVSPSSQSESQGSLDLPHVLSLLDSPHPSLWASVQSTMGRHGGELLPPTPSLLGLKGDDRGRLWNQTGSTDADLFSATSQVMQMGASPLLGGDYLMENSKMKHRKVHGRRSPADDILEADDSNESYERDANSGNKRNATLASAIQSAGKGAGGRRKKPYISPEASQMSSGELLSGSLLLSPPDGSSSVEKLSIAVKNQKFGLSSVGKTTAASSSSGASTGRRALKSQHSQLENFDLSQYFDVKHEDSQGDDSNNAVTASAPSSASKAAAATEVTVCNCKKSKCLKLYCDCFAVMNYCSEHCNCADCCNTSTRETIRQDAIRSTKERNAFAFQTKINEKEQHLTGCHCKNSMCLKKYCECYTGGAICGENCKCKSCMNFAGSVDLLKARSAARDSDGPGSSRKRKESPSSVAFLDNNSPPGGTAKIGLSAQAKEGAQVINFSPELRGALGAGGVGMVSAAQVTRGPPLRTAPQGTRSSAVPLRGAATATPLSTGAYGQVGTPNNLDMQQLAKRTKMATPVPADRQLRSRKPSGEAEELAAAALAASSAASALYASHSGSSAVVPAIASGKKRTVKFAPIPIVYPFFGADLPPTSKIIALKCLDFLEGKDIYAMSQVNHLWSHAAMDDALWE